MDEIKEETPLFKAPIILFDNDCILCKRFKESLEKIPEIHEYSFIPIQNDNIFFKVCNRSCYQNDLIKIFCI